MRAAHIAEIVTPKKYLLNGLWLGINKPHTVYIWVHGLGSSAFSKLDIASLLAQRGAAVLMFNNRGHDKLSMASYKSGLHAKRKLAGGGAEVFEECVDDIEGALALAKSSGAKNIYLVGHSTGCQKSVYWASKRGSGVKGIILLAPISDYSATVKKYGKAKVARVAAYARSLTKKGKGGELIPLSIWPEEVDTAQRFLSLYTPDSVEEIFTYSHSKDPRTLKKVRIPMLVLLAEHDEFGDRPAKEIAAWFRQQLDAKHRVEVVANADHGFRAAESRVASAIRRWVLALA